MGVVKMKEMHSSDIDADILVYEGRGLVLPFRDTNPSSGNLRKSVRCFSAYILGSTRMDEKITGPKKSDFIKAREMAISAIARERAKKSQDISVSSVEVDLDQRTVSCSASWADGKATVSCGLGRDNKPYLQAKKGTYIPENVLHVIIKLLEEYVALAFVDRKMTEPAVQRRISRPERVKKPTQRQLTLL